MNKERIEIDSVQLKFIIHFKYTLFFNHFSYEEYFFWDNNCYGVYVLCFKQLIPIKINGKLFTEVRKPFVSDILGIFFY